MTFGIETYQTYFKMRVLGALGFVYITMMRQLQILIQNHTPSNHLTCLPMDITKLKASGKVALCMFLET